MPPSAFKSLPVESHFSTIVKKSGIFSSSCLTHLQQNYLGEDPVNVELSEYNYTHISYNSSGNQDLTFFGTGQSAIEDIFCRYVALLSGETICPN